MPDLTNITPPRVPVTDPRTGLISREWYRFFLNIFTITGNGSTVPVTNILGGDGIGVSLVSGVATITNTRAAGVTSFNTRTGAVTLTSGDVTTALGFSPVQSFNTRTGTVTLTSGDVTTALGFTPQAALGYTPINKAGDTGIGNLSMGALTATGGTFTSATAPTGVNGLVTLPGPVTPEYNVLTAYYTGCTYPMLAITQYGLLTWGGGSGIVDTTLYRSGAATLRVNNHLEVASSLTLATKAIDFGSKELALSATPTTGDVVKYDGSKWVNGALPTLGPTSGGTGITTYALGDTLYSSAADTLAKLAGNTTTTKKFLTQTGDGVNSAAPAWGTILAADVPTLNQNTTGTSGGLTGTPNITVGTIGCGAITGSGGINLSTTPRVDFFNAGPGSYYLERSGTAMNLYSAGSAAIWAPSFAVFDNAGVLSLAINTATKAATFYGELNAVGATLSAASSVTAVLTVDGLQTREDKSQPFLVGRYSSGYPWSYMRPSSGSSGWQFVNAANSVVLLEVPNATQATVYYGINSSSTTNDSTFQNTIIQKVAGGYGWRDLMCDIDIRGGAGSAGAPTLTAFRDNVYIYAFPDNLVKECFANFHIDHDYAASTDIYLHAHWSPGNNTDTGSVVWAFEYTVAKGHQQGTSSDFPATTTIKVTQAAAGVAYRHYVGETAAVSSANFEPDALVLTRIYRDTSDAADTFNGVAFLMEVDVHYQCDRMSTKNKAPNFYS